MATIHRCDRNCSGREREEINAHHVGEHSIFPINAYSATREKKDEASLIIFRENFRNTFFAKFFSIDSCLGFIFFLVHNWEFSHRKKNVIKSVVITERCKQAKYTPVYDSICISFGLPSCTIFFPCFWWWSMFFGVNWSRSAMIVLSHMNGSVVHYAASSSCCCSFEITKVL